MPIELHASALHTLAPGAPLPKPYVDGNGVEMVPVMMRGGEQEATPLARRGRVAQQAKHVTHAAQPAEESWF